VQVTVEAEASELTGSETAIEQLLNGDACADSRQRGQRQCQAES
jgi:hypothetical protein